MVRMAQGGQLHAWGYGRVSSSHVDPIEKKPLYHFRPGSLVYSIGGWGCNFRCRFCQNWSISQQAIESGSPVSPEDVVGAASSEGAGAIAYTYNEPLVGYEFVLDCARMAREAGLVNVLVTNGFINAKPAADILPLVDAMNVDVKSMSDSFYRDLCGARLQPVLDFCRQAVESRCHVEITNLVIPGRNDDDDDFERLSQWILSALGASTPLHLSAYFPQYKMDAPPTSEETLERAYAICSHHLPRVYVGNARTDFGRDTACLSCGSVLVTRMGYSTRVPGIENGRCRACGAVADFVTVA